MFYVIENFICDGYVSIVERPFNLFLCNTTAFFYFEWVARALLARYQVVVKWQIHQCWLYVECRAYHRNLFLNLLSTTVSLDDALESFYKTFSAFQYKWNKVKTVQQNCHTQNSSKSSFWTYWQILFTLLK